MYDMNIMNKSNNISLFGSTKMVLKTWYSSKYSENNHVSLTENKTDRQW